VVGRRICSITNPTFTFPQEIKERTGQGLLRVYTGDAVAKELMELSDGEALEVLAEELISTLPGIRGKIVTSSIKHWRHAISPWRPGRLELVPALQASIGDIHFCGDYTDGSGMDGAVHSADRVLEELQKSPA
jgi:monoamine oxidase